ncbi:hypothetical protein ACH35V_11110 [Actinomadura sp. 1N219]|uniref:hypothetical protein n=1 Tax=Actinomadura sp. 1N219 TaxID=3375152 RepID=UPI003794EF22
MKGDKGSGDIDGIGDISGMGGIGGDEGQRNPYPLPGQDWDQPALPVAGGRQGQSGRHRLWPAYLGMVAIFVLIVSLAVFQISGLGQDDDDSGTSAAPPSPPSSPEPEPVSTVPPKVKGWRAVSSAKYGMAYDVSKAWRILPTETLSGFDGLDGKDPVMMSSAATYRKDACKDGDSSYNRGSAGFNQYIEGDVAGVARDAANKWATHAYTVKGDPAPVVTLRAPKAVKVGRDKGVLVRADVVIKAQGRCDAPTAIVHAVAMPGVAPGKTTVFVLMSDQGVPDAMPKAELTKVLGSLRPSQAAKPGV